ncbi:MAG: protein kinase domain-containing protein [Gemmatimonadaceae bacterium]
MSEDSDRRWQEVGALFSELVTVEQRVRAERLAAIGASDPALRRSVEALLSGDARADEWLSRFETGIADQVRATIGAASGDIGDPLGIVGSTISHFRVTGVVASGGMGVVYRADDVTLHRTVALKFPLPHLQPDAAAADRLVREAQSIGALNHVNLCTAYEVGESEQGVFLAMPLYAGETLKQRLVRTGVLPIGPALDVARQIAEGLACAHDARVVHRDLKPGNVMLLPDGTVKLLDFGLAKVEDVSRTRSGAMLGTISYMAPEQVRGHPVDARADLWSLGVLLYEMLTGVRPFAGEREVSIAHAILHAEPKPPSALRGEIPRAVQEVVLALLQKDAADRYPGARELATDLAALHAGGRAAHRPPLAGRATRWARRHRAGLAVVAMLAIALIGVAAVTAPRWSSAVERPTGNAEAYAFYLRGREYEQRGPQVAAESLYRRALALDSEFAMARARLAIIYAACRRGGSRDCYRNRIEDRAVDRLERIRTEAQTALRQRPGLADAHLAMGLYWEQREDPARALAEYELARRGLSTSGALHAAIGRAHRAQGRWNEAIHAFERATELDPTDAESIADLATTYSRLRRWEEAVRSMDRYLMLVPDAYSAMMIRGNMILRWRGTIDTLAAIVDRLPPEWRRRSIGTRVLVARIRRRPQDGLAALAEGRPTPEEDPGALQSVPLMRAQLYHELGDTMRARAYFDSARVVVERIASQRPRDFRPQITLGNVYAGLGRAQEAKRAADSAMRLVPTSRNMVAGTTAMRGAAEIFAQLPDDHTVAIALLERLLQMPAGREATVPYLRVDPRWDPLRRDPRFQRLLVTAPPT